MSEKTLKKSQIFLSIFIVILIFFLIANPQTYMQSTLNGLNVWISSVLPALFPFFFLTKLLTELKVINKISVFLSPISKKLFKCPGISAYVFLMSIISGYPVGAKLISELFKNGQITQSDAIKMNSFCSTSGPLFVVGTVGVSMFFSKTTGFIILFSHIVGAIINGLLYRNIKIRKNHNEIIIVSNKKPENILSAVMYDSIVSILMVGGFISVFFVFIDILNNTKIIDILSFLLEKTLFFLHLPPDFFNATLNGLIEITHGALDLSMLDLNIKFLTVILTGMISFGGLSIHLQSLIFLKNTNIKMGSYFLQKTTHSIISMIVCFVICLFL